MSAPNERVDLVALKRPRLGGKEPTRLSHQRQDERQSVMEGLVNDS